MLSFTELFLANERHCEDIEFKKLSVTQQQSHMNTAQMSC